MIVIFSEWFKYEQYPTLSIGFKLKLKDFKEAIENDNMSSLKGRNKSSEDVNFDTNDFINQVKYSQKYNLWHYHLGIPKYEKAKNGDLTSDYILHYRLLSDRVVIIQISQHPFKFPEEYMMEKLSFKQFLIAEKM